MTFEKDFDCVAKFKEWIVNFEYEGEAIASLEKLDALHDEAKKEVRQAQKQAWKAYQNEVKDELNDIFPLIEALAKVSKRSKEIDDIVKDAISEMTAMVRHGISAARVALRLTIGENSPERKSFEKKVGFIKGSLIKIATTTIFIWKGKILH